MFASFLHPKTGASRSRRRLGIEVLENRDCPASLSLETTVLPGHVVELSGAVVGEFTPGAAVAFTGAVDGICQIDESGHYSFFTMSGSLGDVDAVGILDGAAFTDPVTATISTPPPVITLSVLSLNAKFVTFSGTLTGLDVGGQNIQVSNMFRAVTTDEQGNFSFAMPRYSANNVQVSAIDLWGQQSNVAEVNVPTAPLFITMTAVAESSPYTWTFSGTVTGSNVAGLIVTFGGVNDTLQGTAVVDSSGYFSFTFVFSGEPTGTATASITMPYGVLSNTAIWNF
jgi:hypothetical protein